MRWNRPQAYAVRDASRAMTRATSARTPDDHIGRRSWTQAVFVLECLPREGLS